MTDEVIGELSGANAPKPAGADPERLKEIFWEALQRASTESELAYLDLACAGDAVLRKQVDEKLARARDEDSFLDGGIAKLAEQEIIGLSPLSPRSPLSGLSTEIQPESIGRYRIIKELGRGGFGLVYLALDGKLARQVAIKVPHPKFLLSEHPDQKTLSPNQRRQRDHDAKKLTADYLNEARNLASLSHPNIVQVYDCGSTDRYPCYIVSQYIDGDSLAARMRTAPPSPREAAKLIATIAEALHYAHGKGVYHRDIKPANLFLDHSGTPYVGDFGLALREEELGSGHRSAGTPAYMSPEQASGKGHLVNGCTDVFSLCVVLYELLSGVKPFRGDSSPEILKRIKDSDPKPPRQYEGKSHIARELERICLKGLSKTITERYTTAKDLADELRLFLNEPPTVADNPQLNKGPRSNPITPPISSDLHLPAGAVPTAIESPFSPSSEPETRGPAKIVPKGLCSFDANDADFFLELVPGARDRNGLPERIRFWKTRIEGTEQDQLFRVGIITGPSGCGKSSLVKAGLLPALSKKIIAVYLEATPGETEIQLLKRLQRRCPQLPVQQNLPDSLRSLRLGQGLPTGKKVLIVLDQFEQWLKTQNPERRGELVQALAECDGEHLQCILMVRGEFYTAAAEFLYDLDIHVSDLTNMATVKLFDREHARAILCRFGHALGRLPEDPTQQSPDQQVFLQQALSGLEQEGKFIPVRLSLFADMMSSKPWVPASLREVGGTSGLGFAFLEEKFESRTAIVPLRKHQVAARAVLNALLPESGAEIKGQLKSYTELQSTAGYDERPREFETLIRTLDTEVRLITPTAPAGMDDEGLEQPLPNQKYYQLTHDYLVPELRDWLTRKQQETRRGRAALRLAERAAIWKDKPESRHLPSLREFLMAWWFVPKNHQTAIQQRMMSNAARIYGLQSTAALLLITGIAGLLGYAYHREQVKTAESQVHLLMSAKDSEVLEKVSDLKPVKAWAHTRLLSDFDPERANPQSPKTLRAALAIGKLYQDEGGVASRVIPFLRKALLTSSAAQFPQIRTVLAESDRPRDQWNAELWKQVDEITLVPSERFHALAALATFDPENPRWEGEAQHNLGLLLQVLQQSPTESATWIEAFQPIKEQWLTSLEAIFAGAENPHSRERENAARVLAEYTADQPDKTVEYLLRADESQFPPFFAQAERGGDSVIARMTDELDKIPTADSPSSDPERETLALRQVNAAVALVLMGKPARVWPLLTHTPDPRVRSYLIHRFAPLGVPAKRIFEQIDKQTDPLIRSALVLSLGEYESTGPFDQQKLAAAGRVEFLPKLKTMFQQERNPGLHGACDWLLRKWGEPLPEVTLGEPELSEEQQAQLAQRSEKYQAEIGPIRAQLETAKTAREQHERQWEQQLTAEPLKGFTPATATAEQQQIFDIYSAARKAMELTIANFQQKIDVFTIKFSHDTYIIQWKSHDPQWYTNHQSQTMIVLPRGTSFIMESPIDSLTPGAVPTQATRHETEYAFCVSAKTVTIAEYEESLSQEERNIRLQFALVNNLPQVDKNCPFTCDNGDVAASYCNRLTKNSGLSDDQCCYATINATYQLKPDWIHLSGYRLLTDVEYQATASAGVITTHSYGDSVLLLGKYSWYDENSDNKKQPVGKKKPNELGMFDITGNVLCWICDANTRNPNARTANSLSNFSQQGSAFDSHATNMRSANKQGFTQLNLIHEKTGFRVAKTMKTPKKL